MFGYKDRNREVLSYLFFGLLTTLVNFIVYYFGQRFFPQISLLIINVFAWIISVAFAYFTNREYVFTSNAATRYEKNKEITSFFGGRIATLGIEEIIIFVGIALVLNANLVKLFAQAVIIILNYVISKFLVFK